MAFRNQRGGFALLLLLALGAFVIVGGAYFFAAKSSRPDAVAARPEDMFDRLRDDAEKALATPEAVNASLPRNANAFGCLYSSTGDCAGRSGTPFLLYESGEPSAQPLSQLGKDAGLTAEGLGCRGFPGAACPLRVEAVWEPVCAAGRCENTKSLRVKVKVTYHDGVKAPVDWEKSGFFTPVIQLARNVACERGGGVWANTECLTPEQAAQRSLASARSPRANARDYEAAQAEAGANPVPIAPDNPDQYICPGQIVVQGAYYPVDFISAGRGQVRVPAMNGCPAEDTFVFQCNRKEPAAFEGEGQWIQTEAVMAGTDCQTPVPNAAPQAPGTRQ